MNVCIVGGGHIGTTLTSYIKHAHPEFQVRLFTRRPEDFSEELKCNDIEQETSYYVKPDAISNDPGVSAKDADIVFIALPHFAIEKAFSDIAPYVSSEAMVGVIPGGGGCEFIFKKYFSDSHTLFGFQRVPFTAKLQAYGKETNLKSWKPFSVVGTIPGNRVNQVCERIESCGLKTQAAANFLEIALTPTNPILHTSRTFDEKQKFYVGWTDAASRTLFAMDGELHHLLDAMSEIDTSAIRPLSEHYESPTIEAMTAKINSIATFQTVYAPMKPVENGYVPDLSSRMFTEDFPWGLAVIRSYFDYFDVPAPTMDKVLGWYAGYMGLDWYKEGRFIGHDLKNTGVIKNYGISTVKELLSIYQ